MPNEEQVGQELLDTQFIEETTGLLDEAKELISSGNIEEGIDKINAAEDKIRLPIGGGSNGPVNKP